jgi:hypothetical protein
VTNIAEGIGSAPNGIRIHVGALKGLCPRPLDDGGVINPVYQMHLYSHKLELQLSPAAPVLEYNR